MKMKNFIQNQGKIFFTLCVLLFSLLCTSGLSGQDTYTTVGAGSYRNTLAGSAYENDVPPSTIYKTDNLTGALPTNEWWSSALFRRFSTAMYPHPLAAKAYAEGLGVSYPEITVRQNTHPITSEDVIDALYDDNERDFVLGGAGFVSESALVSGYSDWQVSLRFADAEGTSSMTTALTMGSPYIYVTYSNITPTITFDSVPVVWSGDESSDVLGININGNNYGLFAPTGSVWSGLGTTELTCILPGGKNFLSIAVLADSTQAGLEEYAETAYAFVTDTKVAWAFDGAASSVYTTYSVTTTVMEEGKSSDTISVLYPHQWNNSSDPALLYTYRSSRGTMKTVKGKGFTTAMTYRGILPNLPNLGADRERLAALIDQYEANDEYIIPGPNSNEAPYGTYWIGKNLNRLSQIIPLAEQVGDQEAQERFTAALRITLERWLNPQARPDEAYNFFYYNPTWGSLTGYDSGYGAAADFNDHHFHYGYYIYAAALLARYDAQWASSEQFGQMVNLIVKEIANPDRDDTMFPFLRNFDTYAGHSWADGNADGYTVGDEQVLIDAGNNQESSSEAINAWAGLILWGEETGNFAIRDLGIYLYTTEVEAINSYWFDINNENLPAEYTYDYVPMLFSGGGEYRVWWSADVEFIHGINMLPITGSSFYLGTSPEYCEKNYNKMVLENIDVNNETGIEVTWPDVFWKYQALYDPQTALAKYNANESNYGPEFGTTRASTYHWIANFCEFGTVNTTVTADTALYAVFDNGTVRTYAAYNPGTEAKTVTFSDGVSMSVLPKEVKTKVLNTELAGMDTPDLVLKKISYTGSEIYPGDTVAFTVTVQNQGYADAFDENNSVGMIISVDGQLLGWGGIGEPVESGDTVEMVLRADWSSPAVSWTAVLGEHQVEAWVNNQNLISEANFDNNRITNSIVVNEPPTTDTLYFNAFGAATVRSLSNGPGEEAAYDTITETGSQTLTYTARNINGEYDGSTAAEWDIYLDSLDASGSAVTVNLVISYDFTGDGTWDRIETSSALTLDNSAGWELFTAGADLSVTGSGYQTFVNGMIKAEITRTAGSGNTSIKVNDVHDSASRIRLPYPVLTVTAQPDLQITDLSWSPANPEVGQVITFSATVTNMGNAAASDSVGSVGCAFYVLDGISGERLLTTWGWVTTPIAPGESMVISNLPGQGPALGMTMEGTYTVQAFTDDQNSIPEYDDTNNSLEKPITIEGGPVPDLADLVVTGLSWTPETPYENDMVVFTLTVENQGTVDASNDDNSVGMIINVDGQLLGYGGVSEPIAAGASVTMQLRADWGSPAAAWLALPGGHTVEAVVDNQNDIPEINEQNNTLSTIITVNEGTPDLADLIITDISWTPETPFENDMLVFTVTVQNQGTVDAFNQDNSVGMIINVNGELLGWGGISEPIAAGGSVTMQLRADWASPAVEWLATPGDHTVEAFVDNMSQINEISEENNNLTKNFTVQEIPELADLTVTDISWTPETPYENDQVVFTLTVENQGTAAAANSENAVGMIISVDGQLLGWGGVSEPIEAGQSVTMQLRADWGTPATEWLATAGDHTVEALVDNMNQIVEGNEENNALTKTITVAEDTTAPEAKLVFPGDWFRVDVKTNIVIEFTEAVDRTTINTHSVFLKKGRKRVKADLTLSADGKNLTINPVKRLNYGKWYKVRIKGDLVTDLAGNKLTGTEKWYFLTDWNKSKKEKTAKKVYSWLKNMQGENGLLESAENSDLVSLYDNALAALAFIEKGDYKRAEKIFDFFNAKLESEFKTGNGGFGQFRNSAGEINGEPNRWLGDNAWLLIALNNYHSYTNNKKYKKMALEIENWIRSLQDTNGGLWGGTGSDGEQIPMITEGIIDAYNAVGGYDDFHKNILRFLQEQRWDENEQLLTAWPENPRYIFALDLHSWGYSIFEDYPEEALKKADRYKAAFKATVNSEYVAGYCFDEDRDTVWLEGTGEMAVAYNRAGNHRTANQYLQEMEKMYIPSSTFENSGGMPYVTNMATTYGGNSLWEGADTAICISSSAWYLFAKKGFNPFEVGREKNIPAADKFWVK